MTTAMRGEMSCCRANGAVPLASREPMWDYARKLDNVYCAGCHAPIPANHFTLNAWPSVAKGMGARTNISENELDILSRYFQYNAKDMNK